MNLLEKMQSFHNFVSGRTVSETQHFDHWSPWSYTKSFWWKVFWNRQIRILSASRVMNLVWNMFDWFQQCYNFWNISKKLKWSTNSRNVHIKSCYLAVYICLNTLDKKWLTTNFLLKLFLFRLKMMGLNGWEDLPEPLLVSIFSCLQVKQVINCCLVCSRWKQVHLPMLKQ